MPEAAGAENRGQGIPQGDHGLPGILPLVLIIGLYFIAEHGIMNWLVSYATNALEVPMGQAGETLPLFSLAV